MPRYEIVVTVRKFDESGEPYEETFPAFTWRGDPHDGELRAIRDGEELGYEVLSATAKPLPD